jgi:3-deoxy-D-arabino-heptulosonate 7-phosphate (DAHP) synthase
MIEKEETTDRIDISVGHNNSKEYARNLEVCVHAAAQTKAQPDTELPDASGKSSFYAALQRKLAQKVDVGLATMDRCTQFPQTRAHV